MSVPSKVVRAEHDSLRKFLLNNLSDRERGRIGLLSFNQWPWTTAAFVETAVAAHLVDSFCGESSAKQKAVLLQETAEHLTKTFAALVAVASVQELR